MAYRYGSTRLICGKFDCGARKRLKSPSAGTYIKVVDLFICLIWKWVWLIWNSNQPFAPLIAACRDTSHWCALPMYKYSLKLYLNKRQQVEPSVGARRRCHPLISRTATEKPVVQTHTQTHLQSLQLHNAVSKWSIIQTLVSPPTFTFFRATVPIDRSPILLRGLSICPACVKRIFNPVTMSLTTYRDR